MTSSIKIGGEKVVGYVRLGVKIFRMSIYCVHVSHLIHRLCISVMLGSSEDFPCPPTAPEAPATHTVHCMPPVG